MRQPKLYGRLASWWPLMSPPAEYSREARFFCCLFQAHCAQRPRSVLELGSGGGHTASHLKRHFRMTLVDRAPAMLAVSRRLNPECAHIAGDMRALRLNRSFDAVLIHDAVGYMTSERDLRRALTTAFVHCRPGGMALFVPDFVRENFQPGVSMGGSDGGRGGLRYLEWTHDPDPADTRYSVELVFVLNPLRGRVRVVHDRHVLGLFGRKDWRRWIGEAGFRFKAAPFRHPDLPPGRHEVFLGLKPRAAGV
ncbi:MAG: class I SAM-dependent methyltransferase [Verrucomicrobia bacterium]|nr:class I SAM-dependent methyltransferase [Verrucomicrobiota bacterium]MBU1909757.1 class I SAM-dependent methyltransferase [Verrucomicrobiota bacterium]